MHNFVPPKKDESSLRPPSPAAKSTAHFQFDDQAAVIVDNQWSHRLLRPAVSNSSTPEPPSAISVSESYHGDLIERSTKRCLDVSRALVGHSVHARTSASLPLPNVLRPNEQSALENRLKIEDIEIQHPSPRRLASHPVLLQRASTIPSVLCPRSVSDSPRPPPKNPLRQRKEPSNIEETLAYDCERKVTPKVAPSTNIGGDYKTEPQPIKPTVITNCTGPIKRPMSRGKTSRSNAPQSTPRRERNQHTKTRKPRDRPTTTETIDTVVNVPPSTPRQRLKKARPHIQIPDLRPALPAKRTSSTASSNASWKKVTEFPHTSVSTVPCEDIHSTSDRADHIPISPTTSNGNDTDNMSLSAVMLVAEEIPFPKAKSTSTPSKLVTKEGKSYAPRPRSASIPRNLMRRRSRQAVQTSRPSTPNREVQSNEAPPLPSPPPNRALPLPPPGLELLRTSKEKQEAQIEMKNEVPVSLVREIAPNATGFEKVPHVVTQTQRNRVLPGDMRATSDVHARLEALEKHNALLSAALTAVLRTNGTFNSPSPADVETHRSPTVWENRIARRNAAIQSGSGSNGGALEMYMNPRHGRMQGH